MVIIVWRRYRNGGLLRGIEWVEQVAISYAGQAAL